MIKVTNIYKAIILFGVAIMMGLHLMTPSEIIGVNTVKLIVGLIGLILGIVSYGNIKRNKYARYTRLALRYIPIYSICVIITAVYTWARYDYTISQLLISITPYLYIYYSIPLIYIYIRDGEPFSFLLKVVFVVIAFIGLKAFAWYLYNFQGRTLFPRWTFEYGERWIRAGLLRVNVGYLNGITILICAYFGFKKKGNKIYIIILIALFLFLNYVTRMRYLLAVSFISVFVFFYYSVEKRKLYIVKRLGLVMTIAFILTSDYFMNFVTSFSTTGDLGWSTAARFISIEHYWEIIKNNNLILGVGFLITDNVNAQSILGIGFRFFLEDIGIFGGFFRFGIIGFFIYGALFALVIKTCYVAHKKKNTELLGFTIALCAYLILSCIVLNIFDLQRSFDVPFYLSYFSFAYGKLICPNKKSHNCDELTQSA